MSVQTWGHRSGPPVVMGILNVTPDSFSDGGTWIGRGAVEHAIEMVEAGASIIDVGGESTRPGSSPVSAEEELSRLVPVLRDLIPSIDVPVSVDTMKTEVAERCIGLGISIVNDVNALRAEGMLELCASTGVSAVVMHSEGGIFDKADAVSGDVLEEVRSFLESRCEAAIQAGISSEKLMVDPGLGFGKSNEQNLLLLESSDEISCGHAVLSGSSRKRFVRNYYPDSDIDAASAEMAVRAARNGADIIRVHNVALTVEALRGSGLLRR